MLKPEAHLETPEGLTEHHGDLVDMIDAIAGTQRDDGMIRRITRIIDVNGAMTPIEISTIENIPLWDVLAAIAALSEDGKLEHSHTKYTGEEAWKLKPQPQQ